MRTIRTHSFGQEPWDAIRAVILGPAPGALWGAWRLHGDVTANTTGICGCRWLQRGERLLDEKKMSSQTHERFLWSLAKFRASHFKRQRNDSCKQCQGEKLKKSKHINWLNSLRVLNRYEFILRDVSLKHHVFFRGKHVQNEWIKTRPGSRCRCPIKRVIYEGPYRLHYPRVQSKRIYGGSDASFLKHKPVTDKEPLYMFSTVYSKL